MPPIRPVCYSRMDGTDCIGRIFLLGIFGALLNIQEMQEVFNAFDKTEVMYLIEEVRERIVRWRI